jgi:hypothetical protein
MLLHVSLGSPSQGLLILSPSDSFWKELCLWALSACESVLTYLCPVLLQHCLLVP